MQVQHLFLQGKLSLDARVRMGGHIAFKPLVAYWHILDDAMTECKRAEAARREAAAAAAAAGAQQQQDDAVCEDGNS